MIFPSLWLQIDSPEKPNEDIDMIKKLVYSQLQAFHPCSVAFYPPFHLGQLHCARISPSLSNLNLLLSSPLRIKCIILPVSGGNFYHKRIFIFLFKLFGPNTLKVFPQSGVLFFLDCWLLGKLVWNCCPDKWSDLKFGSDQARHTSWWLVCMARVFSFQQR